MSILSVALSSEVGLGDWDLRVAATGDENGLHAKALQGPSQRWSAEISELQMDIHVEGLDGSDRLCGSAIHPSIPARNDCRSDHYVRSSR